MKQFYSYTALLLLLITAISSCQKSDNFLIKEEAFTIVTSGYNGSTSALEITIDTTLLVYPIDPSGNFKRTDKYAFPAGKDSLKLMIKEKETGKLVYQKHIKKGEYSTTINLIYVNGKLLEKPAIPAEKKGFRQMSYLLLPTQTGYTEQVDFVFFKGYQVVLNGELVSEKADELARVTATAGTFSPFLEAPEFAGGRTEIDGKIYFVNGELRIYKAGTNIPYYQEAGYTLRYGAYIPTPTSLRPQVCALRENPSSESKKIDGYYQIFF